MTYFDEFEICKILVNFVKDNRKNNNNNRHKVVRATLKSNGNYY